MKDAMRVAPPPLDAAPYSEQPCTVHVGHSPVPLLTQAHHVFPIELQHELWPEVVRENPLSIKAKHTIPVCGTGHDSIHVILRELIATGGTGKPRGHPHEWSVAIAGYVQFQQAKKDPDSWVAPA